MKFHHISLRVADEDAKLGSVLAIGEINRKLINIRPGICKNNDE